MGLLLKLTDLEYQFLQILQKVVEEKTQKILIDLFTYL